MRLAVIQHESDGPPGLLADWARRRSIALTVFRPDRGDPLPEPDETELIAVLGSDERAVAGELEWVDRELRWLARLADGSVPVLGIGYGAQALAVALGGGRKRARRLQAGWVRVRGVVDEGPWFTWHEDTIQVPLGATVLAESDAGVEAFSHGRHIGVQFHPEATPESIEARAARGVLDLATIGISRAELGEQTARHARRAAAGAEQVFDAFLRRAPVLAPPITLAARVA